GFNIFVCIVLISNTPLFLTYFFKVSGQVLFNTTKRQAEFMRAAIEERLAQCKLKLQPDTNAIPKLHHYTALV
ncbi:hypothetical protein, partial [Wolbachia endosymbiont of Drosophila ananassae]|uniref:hypothetical protein n=1 Tax=Wolbachia endosymbiont of Drosophila ananassae TaxID=307502 RepID=UPI000FF3AFDB